MFVKICGITRPADAIAAVDAGADAIGLNFVPSSPRYVDSATASAILAVLPDDVMAVGVFSDYEADDILRIVSTLGLDAAQLHGDSPRVAGSHAVGVDTLIRVVAVDGPMVHDVADDRADILMLDAANPGSGVPFDWGAVGDLSARHKVLLAGGGLRPENVAEAIRIVRPWGVDVASGVESDPGRKDADAIARFVATARGVAGKLRAT